MLCSLVLAASMSLVGQFSEGVNVNRFPIDFIVFMPGPSPEDLRIQAAMDAYAMHPNASPRRGGPAQTFPTVILRRDVPRGFYLVGRIPTLLPPPKSTMASPTDPKTGLGGYPQ